MVVSMHALGPPRAGAILVNPWNINDVAAAIEDALTMSEEERRERHRQNYMHVATHTAQVLAVALWLCVCVCVFWGRGARGAEAPSKSEPAQSTYSGQAQTCLGARHTFLCTAGAPPATAIALALCPCCVPALTPRHQATQHPLAHTHPCAHAHTRACRRGRTRSSLS
jgi:hypothetical protein